MTERKTDADHDDLELQRYLKGQHPLSPRYREASQQESSPPELDAAVLAAARANTPRQRRRRLKRWALPMGLAASLMIAGPLAWQLWQVETTQTQVAMAPTPPVAERARAEPEPRRVEPQAALKQAAPLEQRIERPAAAPPARPSAAMAAAPSRQAFASDSVADTAALVSPTGGYEGFGPAAFGGDEESVRMAWGRPLTASGSESSACRQLFAEPQAIVGISFMLVEDRFVRYDVTTARFIAPGGVRVGDTRAVVEQRHGLRLSSAPHKDLEGVEVLTVTPEQGEAQLVLEMTPEGTVERWRVGLPPAVALAKGCIGH